jgi:uncharacterized repeat protein (TIGR01451 family)
MNRRLFPVSCALIIGLLGLFSLVATLSLPVAAKSADDDRLPADFDSTAIVESLPLTGKVIAPVVMRKLQSSVGQATPPTRTFAYQQAVSSLPPERSQRSALPSLGESPRSSLDSFSQVDRSGLENSRAPLTPPLPGPANLAICLNTDRVWGVVTPGDVITVAVNNQQMGASPTDAIGFFWTTLYDAAGNRSGLAANDVVTIYHGTAAGATVRSINAQIDIRSDIVSGTIGGVSSPISVTIYLPTEYYEPSSTSISKTVSADASGKFSANFSGMWDFTASNQTMAVVAYTQNGIEIHRHVFIRTSLNIRPTPFNWIFGYAPAGSTVTVSVFYSNAITLKEAGTVNADATGNYFFNAANPIVANDVVVAQLATGEVLSRTVDYFTEVVDAANDRVTGQAKPNQVLNSYAFNLTPIGQRLIQITTTATASGYYTFNFSGKANIMPGQWVWISLPDAQSDDLDFRTLSPSIEVNQSKDEVSGFGAGVGSGGIPVTLTIYSDALSATSEFYGQLQGNGAYDFKDGLPDIAPGDVITVASGAWQGVVPVMAITVQANTAANQFNGTVVAPTSRVELFGNYNQAQLYPINGQFAMLVTATSPFTATPSGFEVRGDLAYDVAHRTANDYLERISRNTDDIGTVIPWNSYGGIVNPPGSAYTVTLYDSGGTFKAQSTGISEQPNGSFWQNFDSSGQRITAGDHLQIQSAAGFSYTAEIPDIIISPDLATDRISGYGPANALLLIGVDKQGQGFVPTDGSGHFVIALNQFQEFWGDGDLKWGESVWVVYYDANNAWLDNVRQWPYINPTYFMDGYNQVNGWTPFPANPVYITVTHPISGVIATATASAGACNWCGPNDYNQEFPIGTVVPGNSVTVDFGDGYIDTIDVVALTGYADPATEIITGTAPPNSVLDIATGRNNDWNQLNEINVDASGFYTADFTSIGWDIRYGDQAKINYRAPHGHGVTYIMWLPAPDIGIEKQIPNGNARPGGVFAYSLRYWNWGNGDANNTIITDTLPANTTYADDTSGFTPDIGSNGVITWQVGTLLPNKADHYFMVTLNVANITGTAAIPNNCVGIATSTPGDLDPNNNGSCVDPVDVWDDEIEIGVDLWASLSDPTPGQEFEDTLQVCNNRSAAAGPIWLTGTLPVSTSLLYWWPEDSSRNYWNEVSRLGGQLILAAPSLAGNTCDNIHLRLLLDNNAPLFTRLSSSIAATVDGDVDLSNNVRTKTDIRTSLPRYDFNASKNMNGGQLVPGGSINYHLHYRNQGNTAAHIWITDTLPANTAYQFGSAREMNGGPVFAPIVVTLQIVVWDLGTIGVNNEYGLDFSIDLSSTITPGTIVTNCATIGLAEPDDTPWDNIACDTQTINDHGPNLRVIKYGGWNKGNYESLRYDAQFMNVGDQQIDNVRVTDTLPLSTSWGWWNMDFDWGRVNSQVKSSTDLQLEFSTLNAGDSGWLHFNDLQLDDWTIRPQTYTNTLEISTPTGDMNPADNLSQVSVFNAEVNRVELRVGNGRIDMWGQAQPNSELMIVTVASVVTTTVDNWGNWNVWQDGTSIDAGDTITVMAGNATLPVIIHVPAPFDVQADSITDRVWGQIDSLDHQLIEVALYDYLDKNAQTDSSGYFTRTFPDVPRGGNGEVRYRTTIDQTEVVFHRDYQSPDLILTVNPSHDWVETNYAAGHTIWITVTDSSGGIKATQMDTTAVVPWWGGQTGFSTNMGSWSPSQPDIIPGDWVYSALDNGYTSTVHIGTVTGNLDMADDSISGTVTTDWFTPMLDAQCWIDNVNDSNQSFSVSPIGGAYACDFTSVWDLVPGENVSVQYQEPDGDWVRTVFQGPASNMWVNKWRDGNGDVAPGGSVVYAIQYGNNGNAAGDAILTDTLPANTTYLTDSSGFPAYDSGGVITWNLGTVLPTDLARRFYLVLSNSASAGDSLHNVIDIGTLYDQDWNNNHAEADVQVSNGQPDLYIKKDSQPGDPTSGQLFRYNIQYGNNGSVASGPVWLTDTLPASTTFVSWQSQNGYNLWTPIITDGEQIVFYAPSIPGNWGDQIFLTLELEDSAAWGTQLTNTVEIDTADEANPGDNSFTNNWTYINGPRYNSSLSKDWGSGAPIPGGTINYWLSFSNNGNAIMHDTLLTDTLPSNTAFITAFVDLGWGLQKYFPPASQDGNQIVWDFGDLPVNYNDGFNLQVAIDPAISAGTIITNCATISISDMEDDPYDNSRCATETVRSAGPNLRVTKFARWQNQNQIMYEVRIENIGTTAIYNVNLTDTLPISATLDWWKTDFWEQSWGNGNDQQITLTLNRLEPNWTTWLRSQINLPTVPNGTLFTNTVEITTPPGDVNPADNIDVKVLGSGPNLVIEKALTDGTPRPGQLLTYTLHYRNDGQWWTSGNVWITDVLPSGVTFVGSQQRLCGPANYFCPRDPDFNDGSTLAWNNGQMGNGWWNDIIVTVRVTDTAKFGDVLTNMALIATDDPANDVDPNTTNNLSTVVTPILSPKFVVGKVYEGNRVAGTVVTYTLTVTNQGNYTGTNIRLIDQVPSNLTYGGSTGTYGSGWITWTIPSIAPNNGTATRWFSGTLGCTANSLVANQNYRVSNSDQNVTSTNGLSISFLIAAPTISIDFTYAPSSIVINSAARYTGTASTNGKPLSYAWNFGDGTSSSGLTATHVYTRPNVYTVYFTASDSCGFNKVQTQTVIVSIPPASVALAGPTLGVTGTAQLFSAAVLPITVTQPITAVWQATGQSAVTHTIGLTDSLNLTWNITGTFRVTITVSNRSGSSVTAARSITIVAGTLTTINPAAGGTPIFTSTNGVTNTVQIPSGALTQTTTLIYTPIETATASSGFALAGQAFNLNAYISGTLISGFTFLKPVTITLYYTDAEVASIDETELKLYTWNGSSWVDAACGAYDRHPAQNWLSVPICHLSRFAKMGPIQYRIFLPLTMRNH